MINKVVLVGDCHGNFEELDKVLTAEQPFDFFLSVGDVGGIGDATPNAMRITDKWGFKGYYTKGNHDVCEFFRNLGLYQSINEIDVAAINGIIKTRTLWRDFANLLCLSHLKNVDILVTHQPPFGLYPKGGEEPFAELLNYISPKIYISGHMHQYKLDFHGQTFIMSLPLIHKGYAVAQFEEHRLTNLEVVMKKGKKVIRI